MSLIPVHIDLVPPNETPMHAYTVLLIAAGISAIFFHWVWRRLK